MHPECQIFMQVKAIKIIFPRTFHWKTMFFHGQLSSKTKKAFYTFVKRPNFSPNYGGILFCLKTLNITLFHAVIFGNAWSKLPDSKHDVFRFWHKLNLAEILASIEDKMNLSELSAVSSATKRNGNGRMIP